MFLIEAVTWLHILVSCINLVGMANGAQTVIITVIGVGVLLILILIPLSFSDVEYYEVSFRVYSAANIIKAGPAICT